MSSLLTRLDGLISSLANDLLDRESKRIMRILIKQKDVRLSGDSSYLENLWDEICAQLQYGYSIYWDQYDDYLNNLCNEQFNTLTNVEREILELYSTSEEWWDMMEEEEYVYSNETSPQSLLYDKVISLSSNYSNIKIRRYGDSL